MYRTAPNPLLVVPGEGLIGILVGGATAGEVLSAFGEDAQIARHADSDVFRISYDYTAEGDYQPDRPLQRRRPCAFQFEHGLLQTIEVGVYQTELYTSGGIRVGSTRAEVLEAFGPQCESLLYSGDPADATDDIEKMRYLSLGIQFSLHHSGRVGSFVVFQTRRRR